VSGPRPEACGAHEVQGLSNEVQGLSNEVQGLSNEVQGLSRRKKIAYFLVNGRALTGADTGLSTGHSPTALLQALYAKISNLAAEVNRFLRNSAQFSCLPKKEAELN
jgi:hypothetical protein